MTTDYAARAQALVGTRFRPQGRGEGGLDCVGVVLTTFGIAADEVRRNYSLRGDHLREARAEIVRHFRRIWKPQLQPGDVMFLNAGEEQLHLAIRTSRGFVHADARIRRVVETPGDPKWQLLEVYRKRAR
jgi:lipoprotein Spr